MNNRRATALAFSVLPGDAWRSGIFWINGVDCSLAYVLVIMDGNVLLASRAVPALWRQ